MGNRNLKGLAVLLIVVLAIAGLAVIPAIAEEEEIAPTPAEGFIARVADHLGVSVEDLESAITAARIEAIEAGMITQEQADRIMERLGEGEGLRGFGERNCRGAHLDSEVLAEKSEALAERLDAAVEAGNITQEQADRIMERLGEGEGFPGRGRRGGRWGGFGACP